MFFNFLKPMVDYWFYDTFFDLILIDISY